MKNSLGFALFLVIVLGFCFGAYQLFKTYELSYPIFLVGYILGFGTQYFFCLDSMIENKKIIPKIEEGKKIKMVSSITSSILFFGILIWYVWKDIMLVEWTSYGIWGIAMIILIVTIINDFKKIPEESKIITIVNNIAWILFRISYILTFLFTVLFIVSLF